MAERRMFAKSIIDSDKFLSMPVSSRLLYYDLGMWADDDGFLNNPKKIIRNSGVTEDDLKILIAKNFIIPFDTGVIVITAWQINNYLRNDRYKETNCKAEKALLLQDENKAYVENLGIPMVDQRDTQYSIGKVRLGKVRLG